MSEDKPQLYLVSPPQIDLEVFPDLLARILDAHPVACLRLELATRDEDLLLRAADALRQVSEPRDVALVISDHFRIARRTGLDGVHLTDGARQVRRAREELGAEAIVGAFCGTSRHEGMTAGETGADYAAFGPVGTSELGDGRRAERELFAWWSEMIELPVVAEGSLDENLIATLSPVVDFISLGEEVWSHDNPSSRLARLLAAF